MVRVLVEIRPPIRGLSVERCRQFALDYLDYGVQEFDAGSGVFVTKLDRWMYCIYDFQEFLQVIQVQAEDIPSGHQVQAKDSPSGHQFLAEDSL